MGILANAVDMHIHGGPDIVPRKLLDTEIAADAVTAGMSAVVLKSHLGSTVERAILVDRMTGRKTQVFGGLALNSFTGGFNVLATKVALMLGAKIVWLPTFTAKTHLEFERKKSKTVNALSNLCQSMEGLSVLNENGEILPEVIKILDMIAETNTVLCCGHIGIDEAKALIPVAKQCGIKKIIYNHPNNPINSVTLDDQKWLVQEGVILERCVVDIVQGLVDWKTIFDEIKATGVSNNLISTDLGQLQNMTPVEGMKLAYEKMCKYGFSEEDIKILISQNPKMLLGI